MVNSWYNITPHYPPTLMWTPHTCSQSFWSRVHSSAVNTGAVVTQFLKSIISQRFKFSVPLKARPVRDSSNQLRGEITFCSPSKVANHLWGKKHVCRFGTMESKHFTDVGIAGHGSQQVWLLHSTFSNPLTSCIILGEWVPRIPPSLSYFDVSCPEQQSTSYHKSFFCLA